jgi:predicted  nucleic acid-binding Zn-ribbon protein
VTPALAALVALQRLDTAAETVRKRLAELPAAAQAIDGTLAAAERAVDEVKARLQENLQSRRALEKDVAGVDTRLARFDDHRAAIKTNQEYTALLHEITTAKAEKSALEDQILVLMELAETLAGDQKAAETALAAARAEGATARTALTAERGILEEDLARLAHDRAQEVRLVDAAMLNKYEQLLKQRRGVAVARITGELCTACHVRLRPHVAQQVRRNDSFVACDSCQRLLYFEPPAAAT